MSKIAELEAEIKELKEKLAQQSKIEQYEIAATDMKNVYDSYVNAGFTEEQAWSIFITQINGASQPRKSLF